MVSLSSDWMKQHPLTMSLLGVPISYVYIYATKYLVEAFNGDLWPQRLIGFSMGMMAFAFLTFIHFNQAITLKTAVTLALATAIVVIQIVWKCIIQESMHAFPTGLFPLSNL
jgi:hypothetical protein